MSERRALRYFTKLPLDLQRAVSRLAEDMAELLDGVDVTADLLEAVDVHVRRDLDAYVAGYQVSL